VAKRVDALAREYAQARGRLLSSTRGATPSAPDLAPDLAPIR